MILTVDIPDKVHRKLLAEKKRTGMSKSLIVRQVLIRHFEELERTQKADAA